MLREKTTITKSDILLGLQLADIRPGDILLVHSALSSIGYVQGGADTVVDALLEAVGEQGTIVMSTLTGWSAPFDPDRSPSAVGRISEVFRRRPGVLRSRHPVHSVAAYGAAAKQITEGHECCETGCGEGTPYLKVRDLGGKAVLLGVDMDRNTAMHGLEELIDARYLRTLAIPAPTYLKQDTFTLQKFPPGHRDFLRITPVLRRENVMVEGRIGQAVLRVIDMQGLYRIGMELLREDPLYFICNNENCNSCHWSRLLYGSEAIDMSRYEKNHCQDPTCEICVI